MGKFGYLMTPVCQSTKTQSKIASAMPVASSSRPSNTPIPAQATISPPANSNTHSPCEPRLPSEFACAARAALVAKHPTETIICARVKWGFRMPVSLPERQGGERGLTTRAAIKKNHVIQAMA